MKSFTILCMTTIATFANAKWDGLPPAAPTSFVTVLRANDDGGASIANTVKNPFDGVKLYANSKYAKEVEEAIPLLENKALASKAREVQKIPTFFWMDNTTTVNRIPEFVADAKKQGGNLAIPLVVYDLPERDCNAKASNGELKIDNDGAAKYKKYIDAIKKEIQAASSTSFILVIEPDSLANLVTNIDKPPCQKAAPGYRTLTKYALQTLNLPNVAMYLDAGHAGWLGWPANIKPAAQLFTQIYKEAGKPNAVRGLVTNVANYNAWSVKDCKEVKVSASMTKLDGAGKMCDEKTYIEKLAAELEKQDKDFPRHFITDTSRNGKQDTAQSEWGNWCNVIGTGFGIRPDTNKPNHPLLDSFVWVKPGGECDGTSVTDAARYDSFCGHEDALKPAPEAGAWFQKFFEQLLSNANFNMQPH